MAEYEVLLGIDSSEPRARAQARAVAALPAAAEYVHATILYVFREPHEMEARQIGGVRVAADVLGEAGVETNLTTRVGEPAEEIVRVADDLDANVISLGEWDRTVVDEALHGSVTRDVVRRASRPVLLCYSDPDSNA